MPTLIATNAIPTIAFAPILIAWVRPYTRAASKMAIAAVLCFFPVLVTALQGLRPCGLEQIELMRSYAAGEIEIFRRVRIPASLPYLFAALKVASVLAMIGAIVGEYFGGRSPPSASGSGALRSSSTSKLGPGAGSSSPTPSGSGSYLAVSLVERVVVRWLRHRGS